MKILITGSNGLLGQKLVKYCLQNSIEFIATSKGENRNFDCPEEFYSELDICETASIENTFIKYKPTHIIHTAAITNVDHCELHPDDCKKVNIDATKSLVKAANQIGAHFQFVSTDFVFDGAKGNYSEVDQENPVSVYGTSKLRGEEIVKNECINDWSIVRTIIVYGRGNNLSRSNLIIWAKGALEKGEHINIIDDQFRAPTFADDLAKACIQILLKGKSGIFHISGPETLSIYEIVRRIANHFSYSMSNVKRISSATLNQPAKRPPKTGFDLTKARNEIDYSPYKLEETLDILFND